MDVIVDVEKDPATKRRTLEVLTARLPQWFGHSESNRHYARQAELLDGWMARVGGRAAGLLLMKQHGPASREIYWLGVDPTFHRRGVGRSLVAAVERQAKNDKVKFLFVMTLHPQVDYEPYQRTRAFYEGMGFDFALPSGQGPVSSSSSPLAYYLKAL